MAVIRATGRPRSVIVTACPAATPATTAEAFCFRARMPTCDYVLHCSTFEPCRGRSTGAEPADPDRGGFVR